MLQSTVLYIPHLPTELEGLRIAHLSDLHATRPRRRFAKIAALLGNLPLDLVFLTGDYINDPGDEPYAIDALRQICQAVRPRLGCFGVFGNHDTARLRDELRELPIHWLCNQVRRIDQQPLQILGVNALRSHTPDALAVLADLANSNGQGGKPRRENEPRPLRLLLSHYPTYLPTASDLDVDVMFCGHTHGGQCRLPGRRVLFNSCTWPLRLTSGILRHRSTLAVVSRGLGEVGLPFRLFCPAHMPVYVLRSGPMPGQLSDNLINLQPW